ncbi:MAG: uncharacterized protein QOK21_72 [Solirubrobacteraceae bacterium]|nr:uncharacterized protein [Solirubrobacteraceae bacterium]
MPHAPITVEDELGRAICERCAVADRPLARLRGLLGRRTLERGEGLLIRPAPSVHTWFMRFPIDVVLLDRDGRVLAVRPEMGPWRVAGCRGARAVLELPAGEVARRGLAPGARLSPVTSSPARERARTEAPRAA